MAGENVTPIDGPGQGAYQDAHGGRLADEASSSPARRAASARRRRAPSPRPARASRSARGGRPARGARGRARSERAPRWRSQPTDMRARTTSCALFAAARERFGGVDVLVNNAGLGPAAPLSSGATERLARDARGERARPLHRDARGHPGHGATRRRGAHRPRVVDGRAPRARSRLRRVRGHQVRGARAHRGHCVRSCARARARSASRPSRRATSRPSSPRSSPAQAPVRSSHARHSRCSSRGTSPRRSCWVVDAAAARARCTTC